MLSTQWDSNPLNSSTTTMAKRTYSLLTTKISQLGYVRCKLTVRGYHCSQKKNRAFKDGFKILPNLKQIISGEGLPTTSRWTALSFSRSRN